MGLQVWAARMKGSVALVDELAGGVEALLLTVLARLAGWVAALPTIVLAARTIQVVFELGAPVALASAVALELVGQAVVNSYLKAREWNATKLVSDARANEGLLLGFCAVYFASDFLLVGALEIPLAWAGEWVRFTALLFPLMQVVSTVLMAERVAQYQREGAAARAKAQRAEMRAERARESRESRRSAPATTQPAPVSRQSAPIRLDKRGFRREVARLNGELAPLSAALSEEGVNRAEVLNEWLQARGFAPVPEGTARGWVPVVLEACDGRH